MERRDMRKRLDVVEQKLDALAASVDQRFDAVDLRFDRLEIQSTLQVEEFRDLVQRTAEGYGATLDHIGRRLDELHQAVTTKFTDHDRVLENHAGRLDAIERR
jgi:tetrahydromethanopterin S-methyltransferase subunit G